ncbi:MAG: hypothetical protein K2N78_06300 [Oscillospiraceae bacterium]|nr:hypothetical protein [Oscillospiraceae bacterium]
MRFSAFNLWTAGIVGLLLVPNLLYALRHKDGGISSPNRAINLLEQIGRFGCMIFMVVPLGVRGGEFGFGSLEKLIIWAVGTALLLLAYYVCWMFYARKPGRRLALALALLPCGIFLLSAILLRHWVLALFAGLFTGAHLYVVRRGGPQA